MRRLSRRPVASSCRVVLSFVVLYRGCFGDGVLQLVAALMKDQLRALALAASNIMCPSIFLCWIRLLVSAHKQSGEGEGGADRYIDIWIGRVEAGASTW